MQAPAKEVANAQLDLDNILSSSDVLHTQHLEWNLLHDKTLGWWTSILATRQEHIWQANLEVTDRHEQLESRVRIAHQALGQRLCQARSKDQMIELRLIQMCSGIEAIQNNMVTKADEDFLQTSFTGIRSECLNRRAEPAKPSHAPAEFRDWISSAKLGPAPCVHQ